MAVNNGEWKNPNFALNFRLIRLSFLIWIISEPHLTDVGVHAIDVDLKEMNGYSVRTRFIKSLVLGRVKPLIAFLTHPRVVKDVIDPSIVIDRIDVI
jgi:hypothetical protein